MPETRYRYWAFISYSHHDARAAVQLHRFLERYAVPRRLVGRDTPTGALPRRLSPIFRDREELPSSAELGGVIHNALRESRYLIVVCSPRAAQSRWVNEEIRQFKAMNGGERVLAYIVDGTPASDDPALECFPPALRWHDANAPSLVAIEPLAADARRGGDGEALARSKLLSGLLGVGLDELLRRERRRRLQRRVAWTFAIVAMAGLVTGIVTWFREREHQKLLDDLVENGRQELLAGSQMRAAVYLAEAYRQGVDTAALRFMLHQAMQPIDALARVIDTGGELLALKFSKDDQTLVTLSPSGEATVRKLPTGRVTLKFQTIDLGKNAGFSGPILSEDGQLMLMTTVSATEENGVLRVWSLIDGSLTLEAPIDAKNQGMSVPFSADGSMVLAIEPNHQLKMVA